jgi:hypothetical protein
MTDKPKEDELIGKKLDAFAVLQKLAETTSWEPKPVQNDSDSINPNMVDEAPTSDQITVKVENNQTSEADFFKNASAKVNGKLTIEQLQSVVGEMFGLVTKLAELEKESVFKKNLEEDIIKENPVFVTNPTDVEATNQAIASNPVLLAVVKANNEMLQQLFHIDDALDCILDGDFKVKSAKLFHAFVENHLKQRLSLYTQVKDVKL